MISGLDPVAEQFLADLRGSQERTNRAERQISSGLKFHDASDAPDQVSDILTLRAGIARNAQVRSNLEGLRTEVNTAEQAVENAVQLVERARVLASQGATGTQSATTRMQIAQEVRSIYEQLLGLSASQVGGRFIFSGDADQSISYEADAVNPDLGGGVTQIGTAQATRLILDPVGSTFTVDHTAEQIFDSQNPDGTPDAGNVFVAVNQLRVALEANDVTGMVNSVATLAVAGDHLNAQLGFYGASQNRIQSATQLSDQIELQFKTELSDKQDADLAEAILEINQGKLQQDASLGARAMFRRTSLFDYLG
jgi:flagellar hook-associated protein 3 FlgL